LNDMAFCVVRSLILVDDDLKLIAVTKLVNSLQRERGSNGVWILHMTISHLNPFIVKVCQCTIVDVRWIVVAVLQHRHAVHEQEAWPLSGLGTWPCGHCLRVCSSGIGLCTH